MRFILSEYITLLKEDGELDTLIKDLLISMKITPISIPQRGRQHGVDIAAVGVDPESNLKTVFLVVAKQKNLTRSNWDSGVNAVRPSLNEIIDTYIPTMLDRRYKKLPVKIVVATNGEIAQNVQIDWKNYTERNTKKKRSYEFWGTGELAQKLDEYLLGEKIFPLEYQSFLKKTLAFLDLSDYQYSHFYSLIEQILSTEVRQKQRILKTMRMVRLCTSIIFKWSEEIDNIKPALICSEHAMLKTWYWISKNKHVDKAYVRNDFFQLFFLNRKIGIKYFNKTSKHHGKHHSLYRYSKNYLEYSLNSWEQLGLIATIGLAEIQYVRFLYSSKKEEDAHKKLEGARFIAKSMGNFIANNPPLNSPKYDEHVIEIALALHLFYLTGEWEFAKKYLKDLIVSFHNNFIVNNDFPLFRTDFDRLVDVYNGDDSVEVDSSMILVVMLEYAVLFGEEKIYNEIKDLVKNNFPNLNLQIWFATKNIEEFIGKKDHSFRLGTLKHSITIYNDMKEYEKEIIEEVSLFSPEKEFYFYKNRFEIIGHLSSRHFRAQPFPIFWRNEIKKNKGNMDTI